VPEPPRRAAVLAIDGGNSKTDVALVAADGTLLAAARGPGSNAHIIGLDQSMAVLADLAAVVARQAGLPGDSADGPGGCPPVAEHVSACLAGADLPEDEEQLAAALARQGWAASYSVVNDTFAILRAGLVPGLGDAAPADGAGQAGAQVRHWGVGVTCGAGINCVALAPDGREERFLSLGPISGDWGGGEGLGREALWWAIRDEDGRGPQTMLREAVPAHFGVPRASDVSIGIHYGKISKSELLGLAPVLLRVAARGDEVARNVVIRLADEIVTMAVTLIRRLGLAGRAVPVVLGGGLLTARDPLLTECVAAELAARAPAAIMRIVDVPAVAGAALLGLDHTGAPPAAEHRLRAAYLTPPPGG
jgi:N-acetylglucosamine kinase-like BadF-type ATPase